MAGRQAPYSLVGSHMRNIDPNLRLLHCIPKLEYLLLALQSGLMFTDHKVDFRPTNDHNEVTKLVSEVLPVIRNKLAALGLSLETLPKDRKQILFAGLGFMTGSIPMICFTEVPAGKSLTHHRATFGAFGLVPRNSWVAVSNAERIIYAGHNSPASQIIFRCLATMHIFGLHLNRDGLLLFNTETSKAALPLLSYFESRDHLIEAEWRIAGTTGYMGGTRNTGTTIPVAMNDIEYVFAPDFALQEVERLVVHLSDVQSADFRPMVIPFPEVMPV